MEGVILLGDIELLLKLERESFGQLKVSTYFKVQGWIVEADVHFLNGELLQDFAVDLYGELVVLIDLDCLKLEAAAGPDQARPYQESDNVNLLRETIRHSVALMFEGQSLVYELHESSIALALFDDLVVVEHLHLI